MNLQMMWDLRRAEVRRKASSQGLRALVRGHWINACSTGVG